MTQRLTRRRPTAIDATGRRRLIVFTRWPVPGRAKTRLIPALGPGGAANLQSLMTDHTLGWAEELRRTGVGVEVRFAGGNAGLMRRRFGAGPTYTPQGHGDLGMKLNRAFNDAFRAGCKRIVAIGTDCPDVDHRVMRQAFDALGGAELVIGPATDGGYYLIGLSRPAEPLFERIDWGTERVRDQTVDAARRLGLRIELLDPLHDIDRPEDLPTWHAARGRSAPPATRGRLSIIIPTRDERRNLPATLERLSAATDAQIIVADGGSTDGTAELAAQAGATVVPSAPGRALQMNHGASVATGDILLFCHADTLLPQGFDRLVRSAANRRGVAGGAFRLHIDHPDRRLRWIERIVDFRSRAAAMPYGDQAIFVHRWAFDRLGGYPDLPIMEDYEMMRGLRRLGRIAMIPHPATTSARYWDRHGVWTTSAINRAVVIGYNLGVPARYLASLRNRAKRAVPPGA